MNTMSGKCLDEWMDEQMNNVKGEGRMMDGYEVRPRDDNLKEKV